MLSSIRVLGVAGWVMLGGALLGACKRSPLQSAGSPDAGSAAPGKLGITPNLIVNGNAESAAGSSRGSIVVSVIPGWSTGGNANVVTYGASGGYPTATDPGPVDRGANFLSGGPNDSPSSFTQHIDLAAYTSFIARGNVTFTLSGYLGGYADQDDNAVLKLSFFGATQGTVVSGADSGAPFADAGTGSNPLSVVTLGPVLAADRNGDTGLLARATTGAVPAQASSIDVELTMTRTAGSANDGYADNLILTLTDEPSLGDAGAVFDAPDARDAADAPNVPDAPNATDASGAVAGSALIGASGGTLSLGAVSLVVPPGALTTPTTISVTSRPAPPDPANTRFLSPLFGFGPDGLVFAQPATLSIDLSMAASPPGPNTAISNVAPDGTITPLPSQPTANGVSAEISHFSDYGATEPQSCLFGPGCTGPAICCSVPPAAPVCMDVKANDPKHCGSCTTDCAASVLGGPHCCRGRCVNSDTDPKNCGPLCEDCIVKGGGCLHGRCAPCRTKIKVIDIPCPAVDICHGTIGTNKNCVRCKGTQVQTCSGTPVEPAALACCDQCPSDANRSNDRPCTPPPADDDHRCVGDQPIGCP